METANRERGTDLFEIVNGLQSQGKMFDSLLSRLITIGNKLSDESNDERKEKSEPGNLAPKPAPRPGAVTELNNCVYGYTNLVERFEAQISKLEKII